jgi:hypothetical protein
LIAENERVHIFDESEYASTWRIVEDATIATIEGSLTTPLTADAAADSVSVHIHYLGKDTKTHLYTHPSGKTSTHSADEKVEPFHPHGQSLGEMNLIERVMMLVGSVHHFIFQFVATTSKIVDDYETQETPAKESSKTNESGGYTKADWKEMLLGLFGLELLKQFIRLQMLFAVKIAKFFFLVTYSIASWYMWCMLLPFRTISRGVKWIISAVTTMLVMILQWLPGNSKKIPTAVNGSSHHH